MEVPWVGNMISVAEAAKHLELSEQYVRRLLKAGQLCGTQIGKTWVVSMDSLINHDKARKTGIPDRINVVETSPSAVKCLSFFSGAMGLDIGLEQAGITTLMASEIDSSCRRTIALNKPNIGLIGDIRNYTPLQILSSARLQPGDDIDLIAGGPPCQAFSTAGKRKGFEDSRGNVFLYFIDIILQLKPRFVVIENVRGLLSAPLQHIPHSKRGENFLPSSKEAKGGALLYILQKLKEGGYGVSFNLYNAANFGAPQIRERVILLCSRDGEKLPYLHPTHSENGEFGLAKWKTLEEALKGLESIEHEYVKFPEKRLAFYRLLKSGQNWRNLPEELQKEALGNSYYAGGGKTGFYRRLAWGKPAPTLVTHPAMPATDLAHPDEDRPLSVQEYLRIQEFPEYWHVAGSVIDKYRQIGNAVPISLGRAIGQTIITHISGKKNDQIKSFRHSRYINTDELSWEQSMRSSTKQQQRRLAFL